MSPEFAEYCPYGHGKMEPWSGELCCWKCGFPLTLNKTILNDSNLKSWSNNNLLCAVAHKEQYLPEAIQLMYEELTKRNVPIIPDSKVKKYKNRNLIDFIYQRIYYGYEKVYFKIYEKYTLKSERKIALKTIRFLCRKCSFNIMYDIKEILEVSKDLKEFLSYIKLAVELGQLGINPTSSLRSIKKISSMKLLNDNEMNALCESIYSITILLLKCPSLKENILEYNFPSIFKETKSIDIFQQLEQIIANCNDLVFTIDDYRAIINNIIESIQSLKSQKDQVLILNLFITTIVFVKNYGKLNNCTRFSGYTLGGFVLAVANASKNINLVEFNNFVLPKLFYVLNSMENSVGLDLALTACRTNKLVEAFNYYKKDGDFRIHFKKDFYEDFGEARWQYELIIISKDK